MFVIQNVTLKSVSESLRFLVSPVSFMSSRRVVRWQQMLQVKVRALRRTDTAGLFEENRTVGRRQLVSVLKIENRMHAFL
jgi:hypothetical protein